MHTTRTTAALALLCACLAGALARDLLVSPAAAEDAPVTRSDVDRVVRAIEKQAEASRELVGAVRDASRSCR